MSNVYLSDVIVRVGVLIVIWFLFFQAEDGIRDLVRSRGLGDVYKRQDEEMETAIKQIISEAITADNVIDIFDAAGLKKPLSLIHI